MSIAKQILFLRLPAAKEFVALVLLNIFLFVQFVSFSEAFERKSEARSSAETYYSAHQTIKPVQSDKSLSLEKLTVITILSAKFFSFEPQVLVWLDESQGNFFLFDQCSSPSLKGRAPPVA